MDFSKIFDDEFNVVDWLNEAFRLQKDSNQNIDSFTGTLITRLQMYIQEMNNSIEETSQQAIQQLPRVLRDIEILRHEATLLQDQMRAVRGDVEKVNQDTAEGMKNLIELDRVKNRIQSASKALQEADNWVTLSTQIDEIFDSKDTTQIAAKLIAMQQSLKILTDVPDYADRVAHLETLKNRLEALVSPSIIVSFNNQDVETARSYAQIFQSIDRAEQLEDLYVTSVKARLQTRIFELMNENLGDQESVFNTVYDYLTATWNDEMRWCLKIFSRPTRVVLNITMNNLVAFHSKYKSQFHNEIHQKEVSAKKRLEILLSCKRITDRFAKTIQNQLQPLYRNLSPMTVTASQETISPSNIETFVIELLSPYKHVFQNYASYEQELLKSELELVKLDTTDTSSSIQLLSASISTIFSVANQSIERCKNLTNGRTILNLLNVLQTFLNDYINELKRVVNNIRERHVKVLGTEDWDLFRQTIRILEICGELIGAYEQFESTLAQQILQMMTEWQNKTQKSKQQNDIFDATLENAVANLTSSLKQDYVSMINALEHATYTLFPEIPKRLSKFSEDCHRFSFDVVFLPVQSLLNGFGKLSIWPSDNRGTIVADLPSFSLVPQENITKVGQYLLMLPQHLEPFNLHDNRSLSLAFKKGKLPHLEDKDSYNDLTSCWLDSLALATMRLAIDETLLIKSVSTAGIKQLLMDLRYLFSVLEDFGLKDIGDFRDLITLLEVDEDKFDELCNSKPARMITAIRSMRRL